MCAHHARVRFFLHHPCAFTYMSVISVLNFAPCLSNDYQSTVATLISDCKDVAIVLHYLYFIKNLAPYPKEIKPTNSI